MRKTATLHLLLLASALGVLAWSGFRPVPPSDRLNWLMEVLPALVGGTILLATYRPFPLTTVTYVAVWFFSLLLMVGGHYTYAEVPAGHWVREGLIRLLGEPTAVAWGLARNHYDRLGHFFQGFAPALVTREVLLRTSPLRAGKWLFFLTVCACLAVSAAYELFEWGYAVVSDPRAGANFLGSQGDPWDAQWDMFLALCGAVVALLTAGRLQDRQLRRMGAAVWAGDDAAAAPPGARL